jgi:two-component system sensor histidine kinase CpxA
MIGELLTLNRLEAEGIERAEPIELGTLARSVVEDTAIEAELRRSRLVFRAGESCTLQGNRELLRRAIENVVRNAIRFTPEGEPVEVELSCGAGRATLRVRDHGPGVPPEALDKIWRPFYRVEGDRARHTGGTGLGLAITEQAVTLHGGEVRAENHPGGGLQVTLELPIGEAAPRRSRTSIAPRASEPSASSA